MSATASAAAALLGPQAGPRAQRVLRRLPAPQPAVQAQYLALAHSRTATLGRTVAGAAVCSALGLRLGWTTALAVWALLGAAGTLLAVLDWRTRQLPGAIVNPCLLIAAVLIAALSATAADWPALLRAGTGWAIGGGLFGLIWLASPRSLGYGDVRLAALLGMALSWLSATAPLPGLFLALVLAAATGTAMRVSRRLDRGQHIPLGPFLIAGSIAAVLLQPR